ncbi:methyltransferase domain-containing protein [Streptomyces hainanensis]|uniref:Methyltransferase domain-containing protein n=1 Tax=Streptomyces hainanensis TaxID=402648 RepID=A0A4R4TG17_9ACTN|nr:methyltransferase domain-containing protein [Streptomyces hainanensis]TDC76427.1 methyltransferase domain-containing protein [Streptomyces hainanensis]
MTVPYLMEDQREAGRLVAKVDADAWVHTYLDPVLPQTPGARVLDVGAGPGHIAEAVLRARSAAQVVAFDGNPERLASGGPDGAGPLRRSGDARALPFDDGSFDVVYSRLMLQYIAERDVAIAEMARVTRPGGTVVLFDLDGQLIWHDPLGPELSALLEPVTTALTAAGFDPHTGRRLYGLAHRTGLTDLDVRVDPYHLIAGRIDPVQRSQWELKLDIARPLLARALGSPQAAQEAVDAFLAHLDSEETLTYSVAFTVTGRRV